MNMKAEKSRQIGLRLRAAREKAHLTQQDLAQKLGLEHRQTLGNIESGARRLTAEELLKAIDVLGVNLDYFTDSFRLAGEGEFSFRAEPNISRETLTEFEETAGCWIATYRELGKREGQEPRWLAPTLPLNRQASYEDAQAAAECIGQMWDLGERPAESLRTRIEEQLCALILNVDTPQGISGAALNLPRLNTIFINRREPEGRRNYDIAHELFHLLTWHTMPPERVEAVEDQANGRGNRVEQLANNFASALLMPARHVISLWEARDPLIDLHDWMKTVAADLSVSGMALKWRLHNLNLLSRTQMGEIDDQRLAQSRDLESSTVLLFSHQFVTRIATALDQGNLSVRRAASLLELSISELALLIQGYGLEPSFDA